MYRWADSVFLFYKISRSIDFKVSGINHDVIEALLDMLMWSFILNSHVNMIVWVI